MPYRQSFGMDGEAFASQLLGCVGYMHYCGLLDLWSHIILILQIFSFVVPEATSCWTWKVSGFYKELQHRCFKTRDTWGSETLRRICCHCRLQTLSFLKATSTIFQCGSTLAAFSDIFSHRLWPYMSVSAISDCGLWNSLVWQVSRWWIFGGLHDLNGPVSFIYGMWEH